MNLDEVIARLAELDGIVERSEIVDEVEKAIEEKKTLLERKVLLEDLADRKQRAKELDAGTVAGKVFDVRGGSMDDVKLTPEEMRNTEGYRIAFLKRLLGRELNEVEKRDNEIGSTDAPGVIPTLTQEKIFNKLKQHAPLLGEVFLLQVPGNVTFAAEGVNTPAALHGENTLITPAADSLGTVTLAGYEIVKILRISATVQKMAINAFEGWLVDYLAEAIAIAVGNLIFYGTGTNQPQGIDYSQTWTDKQNAIDWASTSPTKGELVDTVALLKGAYHSRAKWAMNSKTFWSKVVLIQENDDFKILTDDYKRLLGYEILLDDNVADDDIFFGDFRKYAANLSDAIRVDRSEGSGFVYNAIDYRGTAIFDGKVAMAEAFVKSAPDLTQGKA